MHGSSTSLTVALVLATSLLTTNMGVAQAAAGERFSARPEKTAATDVTAAGDPPRENPRWQPPGAFGSTDTMDTIDDEAPQSLLDFSSTPSENCVRLRDIDRTRVVDDRNILFYLRGGRVYVNQLGGDCRFLARHDNFEYRVSRPRLCRLDNITVIDRSAQARGRQRGATCALGPFYELSRERTEALEALADAD